MKNKKQKSLWLSAGIASLLLLPGCNLGTLDEPTYMAQKRLEIEQRPHKVSLPAREITKNVAARIASDYRRYGAGPVELLLTYDSGSKSYSAWHASEDAGRIASMLRKNGIRDVKTEIFPVSGSEDSGQVLLSYTSITAHAPSGCNELLGEIDDTGIEAFRDYGVGCSVENYIARQVDRPADLLGRPGSDDADGRRQSNIIEGYRSGKPNEALEGGEEASDD